MYGCTESHIDVVKLLLSQEGIKINEKNIYFSKLKFTFIK